MRWPRLAVCDGCGQEVLRARHAGAGRPLTLDPIPVLPECACRACGGTGLVDAPAEYVSGNGRFRESATVARPCALCHGRGRRGEELTTQHVLMNTDGIARPNEGYRFAWEAAHRRHRCPPPIQPRPARRTLRKAA